MKEQLMLRWQQGLANVQQQRSVQMARQWYEQLPEGDRLIVKLVSAVLVLALLASMILLPLVRAKAMAESQLERNRATYQQLADNAGRFGNAVAATGTAPLLTVVTQQARSAGVNLSRYEQDGQALRIWLEKAPFDDAISWLESLQAQQGVRASQISVDKTDSSGRVDIRATLTR
ncbi:hypothetical protein GJQ54_06935 [Oceanospirillaceae bacterium ASx5O]|nr:hypothetical protein GJQ54_06935 [Oceanospirillaceae bacterium ASx5O]